jgi:hypothetical protein
VDLKSEWTARSPASIRMPCPERRHRITRDFRSFALSILLCLIPEVTFAEAGPDLATSATRGQMAGLSGSERLRMFVWGKWLETDQAPRNVIEAMRGALTRNGYYHDGPVPRIVWTDLYATPLLGYETNVNGGVAQDSFTTGGFIFDVDPAYRAVSGVVVGLDGSAETRIAWRNGHTINAAVEGSAGWAPENGIDFSRGSVQLCSRNNLTRWVFLDGCILHAASNRVLSSSTIDQTSVTLSTLFQTAAAYHEVSGEVAETQTNDYDQKTATLALNTVWNQAVTGLAVTFGELVAGQTVLDRRIGFDLRWQAGRHPVGFGLWHSTSRGGTFLGIDQIDNAAGVSVSWQTRPGTTIKAGYTRTLSTAAFYNDDSVFLRVQFDGFGF